MEDRYCRASVSCVQVYKIASYWSLSSILFLRISLSWATLVLATLVSNLGLFLLFLQNLIFIYFFFQVGFREFRELIVECILLTRSFLSVLFHFFGLARFPFIKVTPCSLSGWVVSFSALVRAVWRSGLRLMARSLKMTGFVTGHDVKKIHESPHQHIY